MKSGLPREAAACASGLLVPFLVGRYDIDDVTGVRAERPAPEEITVSLAPHEGLFDLTKIWPKLKNGHNLEGTDLTEPAPDIDLGRAHIPLLSTNIGVSLSRTFLQSRHDSTRACGIESGVIANGEQRDNGAPHEAAKENPALPRPALDDYPLPRPFGGIGLRLYLSVLWPSHDASPS